jgi:hypothetical protein
MILSAVKQAYGLYTFAAIASLIFMWIAARKTKSKTLQEM